MLSTDVDSFHTEQTEWWVGVFLSLTLNIHRTLAAFSSQYFGDEKHKTSDSVKLTPLADHRETSVLQVKL